jgi:predicted GIY-YIG superfamily endonuclease
MSCITKKAKPIADELPWFVYFLRDPIDKQVRYVGCSSQPKKRLNNHLHTYHYVPNRDWIQDLRSRGLLPVQEVVLGPMTKEQAIRAEARLIRLHSVYRPGQLLQRVFQPKSTPIALLFGRFDVNHATPFARTNAALGLLDH